MIIQKKVQEKGMAQKITLSVPDLLHEKLKEWRTSFNLSKMFQEAVTDAIRKKEEFQKRFSKDYNMSEIIKRLKQEKLIWEKQFYKLGKEEGLQWAKTAHYEDLLYVLEFNGTYELTSHPRMTDYFDKIYQSFRRKINNFLRFIIKNILQTLSLFNLIKINFIKIVHIKTDKNFYNKTTDIHLISKKDINFFRKLRLFLVKN